jgi:hypothetical protein
VIDSDTDQRLTVKRPTKWTVCEDILLAVVAVVPALLITGMLWWLIFAMAYLGFMEDMLPYLVLPIAVPLWIWFFRMRTRKQKPPAPELISLGVRCGLYAILCAGVLAMIVLSCVLAEDRMIARVTPRIRKDADIAAIRAWTDSYLKSVDLSNETQEQGSTRICIAWDKLPKCISVLYPQWVFYDADTKCLRLEFCTRLQHWSLVVAIDDPLLYKDGEHDRRLEPGVWICDGQRY